MTNPDIEALAVEQVALALCENALGGKRCPCKEAGKFNCAEEYPGQQARAALTALRSTTAEPVAWLYETADNKHAHKARLSHQGEAYYGIGTTEIPLYTHPTDSAAKDAEKYRLMLLDLLAVIHRDGGHRTQELGIKLSCEQAMRLSSERIAALANRGEAGA